MTRSMRFVLAAALGWSLTGCVFHEGENSLGENGEGGENGPGPGPGPDPDPVAGIPQSYGAFARQFGGNVRLTIVNNSQTPICKMFISPTSEGGWGADWLGPSEKVMPGASRVFGVQPSSYDLLMTDCTGQGDTPGATIGQHRGLSCQSDQTVEVD